MNASEIEITVYDHERGGIIRLATDIRREIQAANPFLNIHIHELGSQIFIGDRGIGIFCTRSIPISPNDIDLLNQMFFPKSF
jgi:hypothetical protein